MLDGRSGCLPRRGRFRGHLGLRPQGARCPGSAQLRLNEAANLVIGVQAAEGLLSLTKVSGRAPGHLTRKPVAGPWASPKPLSNTSKDPGQADASEQQAPKKARKDTEPYRVLECSGGGNCGWNSIGVALALRNGKKEQEALNQAMALGRTLRCDAYAHMQKHAADYSGVWSEDPDATEATSGGKVPTSLSVL